MRITRVYTRAGDGGSTRLVGGQQVAKDDVRIEAYGNVDELNAVLGIVRTFNRPADGIDPQRVERLDRMLAHLQNDLFNVGADLATRAPDRWPGMYRVGDADVKRLEDWCDELNAELAPLEEFVLPGGGQVGAFLHQARTVCRRAERHVVTLLRGEPDPEDGCLRYLNRLSDLLFVAGRWAAKVHSEPETYWQKPTAP
jgi:cob(I)alamin adenosyltransferase